MTEDLPELNSPTTTRRNSSSSCFSASVSIDISCISGVACSSKLRSCCSSCRSASTRSSLAALRSCLPGFLWPLSLWLDSWPGALRSRGLDRTAFRIAWTCASAELVLLLANDCATDGNCADVSAMPSKSVLPREEASRPSIPGMEAKIGMAFLLRCCLAFWMSDDEGRLSAEP